MKETGRGLDLKRTIIASIVSKETRRGTDIGTSMRTVIDVIGIGMTMNVTEEIGTERKSLTRAVDVGVQVRVIAGVVRVARRVFWFQRTWAERRWSHSKRSRDELEHIPPKVRGASQDSNSRTRKLRMKKTITKKQMLSQLKQLKIKWWQCLASVISVRQRIKITQKMPKKPISSLLYRSVNIDNLWTRGVLVFWDKAPCKWQTTIEINSS